MIPADYRVAPNTALGGDVYQSFCDPRLNFEQSLDLAFLVSNYFKKARRGGKEDDVLYAELSRQAF
ncbi:hypothetical protein C8R47DRAFT_1222040 [Mycena vitilis]|nr:hypothetical protein C8R47DRAFT_1222040 [Mycena vitilis]